MRSHLSVVWAADGTLGSGTHVQDLAVDECRGRGQTAATALGISLLPNDLAPGHQLCVRLCVHCCEVLRDLRLSL